MSPLVSIIIPAYNSERWIAQCIGSALAQDHAPKEVIVVDDGSTDATRRVAESVAGPSVKVVCQENRGAAAARNAGLRLAQGEFIQWLDADDLLAPGKIAAQVGEALHSGEADGRTLFAGAWGRFYHDPRRARYLPDPLWEDLTPREWLLRKLECNLWVPPMVFLVSRRLTELAGPWNEKLSLDDDGEYFCRVIRHCTAVRHVAGARCQKRATFGLSHSINLNDRKLDSLAYSLFSYIDTVRSMGDDERTRRACLVFLNRWAVYFHPQRPDVLSRMQREAQRMGGSLHPPSLRRKYRWAQRLLGWNAAKRLQFSLPAARHLFRQNLERAGLWFDRLARRGSHGG